MTGGSLGQRALSYGSLQNSVAGPFHATPAVARKPAKMLLSGPREKEKVASRIFKFASRWRVGMLLLLVISGVVLMSVLSAVSKDEDLPEVPDSQSNPIIHVQENTSSETMASEDSEVSANTGEKDNPASNDSLSNSLSLINEHNEQPTLPLEHLEVSVSTEEKDTAGRNDSSLSNSLPLTNEQKEEPVLPSDHSEVSVNEVSKDSSLPNSLLVINEHEVQPTLPSEHLELSVGTEEKYNEGSNVSSLSNDFPVISEDKEQPSSLANIGYNLPRGNPCEKFAFPPPPSDRKRIGPRPCPVCYVPVEQAIASMPGLPSPSPVLQDLNYVHEETPVATEPFGGSLFGGYPSLKQRNDSFDIKESMTVHCGFVRGSKPGIQSGFDIDYMDLLEMEQCHGVVVASAIFGNYDILQHPLNISEAAKENVCFYMFVDEETEAFMKNSSALDDKNKVGLWRIVVVRNLPYIDARRNGKIPKLLLHRIFTNARFSIWVDGKLQLVLDPYQILERFLWRENATFAISKHYRRFDVFVEAEANKAAAKYDNTSIDFQIEFYRREGLTPYSDAKLPIVSDVPEGCVIIREHISITNLFTCLWFNEVDRFTSRDQLSFSTVRDKIMSKVNWSINMFMDCERRNFVVQTYHRDVLEHMAPPVVIAHYSPPFVKELPRKSSSEIVHIREVRPPVRKRGRERRSGPRRRRTRVPSGNRDAILI